MKPRSGIAWQESSVLFCGPRRCRTRREAMALGSFAGRMLAQVRSWLRAALRRGRLESDMDAELAHYLQCMTADLVGSGVAPDEAARRARIALGSSVVHKDQ